VRSNPTPSAMRVTPRVVAGTRPRAVLDSNLVRVGVAEWQTQRA
jgi:hypothetical protein